MSREAGVSRDELQNLRGEESFSGEMIVDLTARREYETKHASLWVCTLHKKIEPWINPVKVYNYTSHLNETVHSFPACFAILLPIYLSGFLVGSNWDLQSV